jgi:hypothetical protein
MTTFPFEYYTYLYPHMCSTTTSVTCSLTSYPHTLTHETLWACRIMKKKIDKKIFHPESERMAITRRDLLIYEWGPKRT